MALVVPPGGERRRAEPWEEQGKHWRVAVRGDGVVRAGLQASQDAASMGAFLEAVEEAAARIPSRPLRVLVQAHRPLLLDPAARQALHEACLAHPGVWLAVVRAAPMVRVEARMLEKRCGARVTFHPDDEDAVAHLRGTLEA